MVKLYFDTLINLQTYATERANKDWCRHKQIETKQVPTGQTSKQNLLDLEKGV